MKIKNYKLVYDSNEEAYDVYTDDIKSPTMDSSNGLHIGHIFIDDRFDLKKNGFIVVVIPAVSHIRLTHTRLIKVIKVLIITRPRKKAVKALIREYNELFREIFPLSLERGNP